MKQAPPFITFPVAFVIKFVLRAPVTQHGVQPVIVLICNARQPLCMRLVTQVCALRYLACTALSDPGPALIGLIGDALF